MIRFVDGTIDPFLWFLFDWSIRWGVLIVGLAVWFRVRPPRLAATRHLCCATALAVGLFLPIKVELVATARGDEDKSWTGGPVPGHSAIRGLHHVTLCEEG
jgi:hypothetical protein